MAGSFDDPSVCLAGKFDGPCFIKKTNYVKYNTKVRELVQAVEFKATGLNEESAAMKQEMMQVKSKMNDLSTQFTQNSMIEFMEFLEEKLNHFCL